MPPDAPSVEPAAEFGDYVGVLGRRWRIVFAITALALAMALVYSSRQAPVYTASTEILLQPNPSTPGSAAPPVSVETEARLVRSATIGQIAADEMGPGWNLSRLLDRVTVETTPDTLILDLSFWAGDPQIAQQGADAFAEAYVGYRKEQTDSALDAQRDAIYDRIEEAQIELREQNRALQQADPRTAEFLNAQGQRDSLNGQIALLNAQYAQIPISAEPPKVILPATVPEEPSSPNHMINVLLGLFFGLFLGIAVAFAVDRLDKTVRSRDALDWVDAPVLAEIPRTSIWRGRSQRGRPIADAAPRSPVAEAYRTLRAGVVALARRRRAKVIAIVAATAGEGKTATTANLAVVLAQADNQVLAISADLRRTTLHEHFGVSNETGLADVLAGTAAIDEAIHEVAPNLRIMSGGPSPERPSELLQSDAMADLVRLCGDAFDYVLIDTPPVLGLADTLALAPLAGLRVLVVRAGKSDSTELLQTIEMLGQVDASVDAIALVGADPETTKYGYGYHQGDRPVKLRHRWAGGSAPSTPAPETAASVDVDSGTTTGDGTNGEGDPRRVPGAAPAPGKSSRPTTTKT